jgi:hypothetical protein
MTERALNMTRSVTFRDGLFGDGMSQYKSPMASLLATKGIHCQGILIKAMGIVFAASMKGGKLIERAQELTGFGSDACAKISDIANVPRVLTTIEEVGTTKYKELRDQTELKLNKVLEELGNYLTPDQKSMIKDWWLWGDAQVLQTLSEAVKNLEGPDPAVQSTVLLNVINTSLPAIDISTQNKVMGPTKNFVQTEMDKFIGSLISTFKETGNMDTANEQQHGRWVSDAVANTLNLASYGIEITAEGIKAPSPLEALGIILATQSMRQLDRLEKARQSKEYPPWL